MVTERSRAANLANLSKAGPLTPAGRERLRAACRHNQPWKHSTGPRTAAGKARSRMNAYQDGDWDAHSRAMDLYISDIGDFCQQHARGLQAILDGDVIGMVLAADRMTRAQERLNHGMPGGEPADWIAQHRLLLAKYPR
jgi:hypothetical protein